MKALLFKIYNFIKPYLIHYGIFIVILAAVIFWYRNYVYKVKTVIKPTVKYLTKVIPLTKTKIKYKTLTVKQIKYIPEKEYLTITKTKTIPEVLTNKKILAIGKVPAYRGQTQVVCTLNEKTAKADLVFKQLPYIKKQKKFFSLNQVPYIKGGYGLLTDKNGSVQSGIIGIGDRFARIGNFRFRAEDNVYLNSRNTINFIGITAIYKFK